MHQRIFIISLVLLVGGIIPGNNLDGHTYSIYSCQSNILNQKIATVKSQTETKIARLRQASKDRSIFIDQDYVLEIASEFPYNERQHVIDLYVLRWERSEWLIQMKMAEVASKGAANLSNLAQTYGKTTVLSEGIQKYTDMKNFCSKRAEELRTKYSKNIQAFINKYGGEGELIQILNSDDEELKGYY